MSDAEAPEENAELFPKTVGDQLREARLSRNMDLAEVAARTRIPQRHLEAIEQSNYASLPSRTYASGFVKAYARAVGADEAKLARELRTETDGTFEQPQVRPEPIIAAPRRVPGGGLLVVIAIIALIAVAGAALYFGSSLFRGTESPTESAASTANELGLSADGSPAPAPTPTPVTGGHVALTATDQVWVRIYDASGTTLMEKTMAAGERYDVPVDANHPMINIGRPDQLTVTINGSVVAPLGGPEHAIKDVEISADALRARGQPTPGATGTPAPGATAAPAPVVRAPVRPRPTPRPRASAAPGPGPRPYVPDPAPAPAPAPDAAPPPAQ